MKHIWCCVKKWQVKSSKCLKWKRRFFSNSYNKACMYCKIYSYKCNVFFTVHKRFLLLSSSQICFFLHHLLSSCVYDECDSKSFTYSKCNCFVPCSYWLFLMWGKWESEADENDQFTWQQKWEGPHQFPHEWDLLSLSSHFTKWAHIPKSQTADVHTHNVNLLACEPKIWPFFLYPIESMILFF